MTKRPHQDNTRMVILSGAVLLLGAWNLVGLVADPVADGPTPAPALEPELVGVPANHRGEAGSDAGPAEHRTAPEGHASDGRGAMATAGMVSADRGMVAAQGRFRKDGAGTLVPTLDRVFGPDRFARSMAADASGTVPGPATGSADPARSDPDQVAGIIRAAQGPGAGPDAAGATAPGVRLRPDTEHAYYVEYRALAQKDAQEMARQADAVLRDDSENCKKMAALRALYDTNRAGALNYFVQAITTLPDLARAEGVSVPTFAVTFLGKQVDDPAVKGLEEKIAWGGELSVSPDLRRIAAEALIAHATSADLDRYAAYPAFKDHYEQYVAKVAESGATR